MSDKCLNTPCRDCTDENCFRHGDAGADCPCRIYHCCDMPDEDCEHCEFIKDFIEKFYYGGRHE